MVLVRGLFSSNLSDVTKNRDSRKSPNFLNVVGTPCIDIIHDHFMWRIVIFIIPVFVYLPLIEFVPGNRSHASCFSKSSSLNPGSGTEAAEYI